MTQAELWDKMMDSKVGSPENWTWPYPQAFATLSREVEGKTISPNPKKFKWAKGTKVRVVMASRFGDLGISTNLVELHRYGYRVQAVEFEFAAGPIAGQKITPDKDDLLTDIQPIWRLTEKDAK